MEKEQMKKEEQMWKGFSNSDLKETFDVITKDMEHWKDPICLRIDRASKNVKRIMVAIESYTSTQPLIKVSEQSPDVLIIFSEGYRMGPAGDY